MFAPAVVNLQAETGLCKEQRFINGQRFDQKDDLKSKPHNLAFLASRRHDCP